MKLVNRHPSSPKQAAVRPIRGTPLKASACLAVVLLTCLFLSKTMLAEESSREVHLDNVDRRALIIGFDSAWWIVKAATGEKLVGPIGTPPQRHATCISYTTNGHSYLLMLDSLAVNQMPDDTFVLGESMGIVRYEISNGLLGYMNTEGNVILPAQYITGDDYRGGGIAVIENNSSFADIVDFDGDSLLDRDFIAARSFSEGSAAVARGNDPLWGYVDCSGNWLIEPSFAGAESFIDGVAPAAVCVLDNLSGDKVLSWGLINETGEWVVQPEYEYVGSSMEGRIIVAKVEEERLLWGFLDSEGNTIVEPSYSFARDFNGGYAAVRTGDFWTVLDADGCQVTPPKWHDVSDSDEGVVGIVYINNSGDLMCGVYEVSSQQIKYEWSLE